MTVQAQFVPRNYYVFAGLDVDKKSTAVSFTDHQQLKQALRLPYSAEQLLHHVWKHFLQWGNSATSSSISCVRA